MTSSEYPHTIEYCEHGIGNMSSRSSNFLWIRSPPNYTKCKFADSTRKGYPATSTMRMCEFSNIGLLSSSRMGSTFFLKGDAHDHLGLRFNNTLRGRVFDALSRDGRDAGDALLRVTDAMLRRL